ncbi:MAG: hypothetical protein AB9M60_11175 [Leptothrix sp. (in: b-proteobacteria)]
MKRLDSLDFLKAHPTPWLGWGLVGVGVLALLAVASPLLSLVPDNQSLASDLANHRQRAIEDTAAASVTLSPVDRRRQLVGRRLMAQLDAPWNNLFNLLEQHADPQVGLLRMDPDAGSGQFRLTALTKDLGTMAAWLRRLELDPRLADVQIVQHQIEDLTPGRPVRFSLVARWRAGSTGVLTAQTQPAAAATEPGQGGAAAIER